MSCHWSRLSTPGPFYRDPGCPVRFLKLCGASGGQERQPHLPPLSPASLPPLHPFPRGPPLGPHNCIPSRGSTPHPSCLMSKAHDSPTYLGSLPSCPSPTCVSRSPAMLLPEHTRLFHSVLSLQFMSPLTRGLHSLSSLVLTLHLACAQSQPHKWRAQDKHTLSLRRSQSAGRSGPWNTVTARGLWEGPDV